MKKIKLLILVAMIALCIGCSENTNNYGYENNNSNICMSCENSDGNSSENNNSDIYISCENLNNNNNNGNNSNNGNNQVFPNGNYKLKVTNNSTQSGNICIYQTIPDQENNKNIYSLVWFSKMAHPNTMVPFEWDNTAYCFVWSEIGGLTSASQNKDTNPSDQNNNLALFGRNDNGFLFKDTNEQGQKGLLTIKTDETIPNNKASIGIGMSEKPTIVINAAANMTYQFTPTPTYWIVFGSFSEGEVLNLSTINPSARNGFSKSMEIVFPYNVYELSIQFAEDNTWKVLN